MEAVVGPVSQPRAKRQYRTVAERRRVVEETLVPGVSVATVARAHGVNANQVFGWRKLYQSGLLGPLATNADASAVRLLPVTVSSELEPAEPPIPFTPIKKEVDDVQPRSIELTLSKARIRITGQVDTAVLRIILESLRA
jgi:transposase